MTRLTITLLACCAAFATGCGGDDAATTADLPDGSPVADGAGAPSPTPAPDVQASLGDRLRRLIQARVDETGNPQADDAKCSALKLKYGSSADVAADHGGRVARQMRTLCPAYFVPPGRSEQTDTPPVDERKDGAYTDSKDLCGIFGVEQVASEYGGDPSDPTSVAQAYAKASYQETFRESAEAGCLAGLVD